MYVNVEDRDIPFIVDLINRAYRGVGGSSGWSNEEAYLEGDRTTAALLRADISAKPSASLLKWIDADSGALTGCVWLEPINGETWYLGSLAINPEFQNGGFGRKMLEAAEAWVLERGAKRVRMTVINVRGPLISWYERRGYVRTGGTQPFPYGDNRFGRPLRDDLSFIILEKDLQAPIL
jgi:ribosomal protein S18 acetylase RimI-like enzyme